MLALPLAGLLTESTKNGYGENMLDAEQGATGCFICLKKGAQPTVPINMKP